MLSHINTSYGIFQCISIHAFIALRKINEKLGNYRIRSNKKQSTYRSQS